ncbi:MAG: hypothetical protein U0V74_13365 [Chitinophagales bacterium]
MKNINGVPLKHLFILVLGLLVFNGCKKEMWREKLIAGNYHTIKSYHGSSPTSGIDTVYGFRDITIQAVGPNVLSFIDPETNDTLIVSYDDNYSSAMHTWYYNYFYVGGDNIKYNPKTKMLTVSKGWTSAGGSSFTQWEGFKSQ